MQFKSIVLRPLPECVTPGIECNVTLLVRPGEEAPISICGQLRAQDRKLLVPLVEDESQPRDAHFNLQAFDLRPHGTNLQEACFRMVGQLDRRHIDHIEDRRASDERNDVILRVSFSHRYVETKMFRSVVHLTAAKVENAKNPKILYVDPEVTWSHSSTNILHPSNDWSVLDVRSFTLDQDIVIPASDWVHKFVSAWSGTNHVVFEIPKVSPLPTNHPIGADLDVALQAAREAEAHMAKGEWNEVCEELRGVWEVLRKNQGIEDVLRHDGYSEDAAAAVNRGLQGFFDVSSKFLHKKDQQGRLAPEIRASKEDAQLTYTLAVSTLNLIARKANRLGTP